MRIAQIAPVDESVPPARYGGIERVVSYLTEELVNLGMDVTLFATGDSVTSAKLVPIWDHATRAEDSTTDPTPLHVAALEEALHHADEHDVFHFHLDWIHFPVLRRQRVPNVTTLHNRIDLEEFGPLFHEFRDMPVVSISEAQQRCAPMLNWAGTVHHGLPPDTYSFHEQTEPYLAFLGRICRDKGIKDALEIAHRAGMPLKIAAKVDHEQQEYFESVVQPALNSGDAQFVGEVNEGAKNEFLGKARALIFPIHWPEPFGLVMIEALACGTPVIAFCHGAVPEVLEEGVTGFICDDIDTAVDRVGRIDELDRQTCRQRFEERFSVNRMANDYLAIFDRLIGRK